MTNRIAFIGGGNMTTSLVGGLVASRHVRRLHSIVVSDPETSPSGRTARSTISASRRQPLTTFGRQSVTRELVVLAVKPQQMARSRALASPASSQPGGARVVVSIAAGIRLAGPRRAGSAQACRSMRARCRTGRR